MQIQLTNYTDRGRTNIIPLSSSYRIDFIITCCTHVKSPVDYLDFVIFTAEMGLGYENNSSK